MYPVPVFGVWLKSVGPQSPSSIQWLYPRHFPVHEAAPQCISGRTSYHRTRLAFHSYPQVIQDFFNRHWFGPPPRFTGASTCPWIDRTASGLRYETNSPYSDSVSLRLRTSLALNLATHRNSPAHSSIGTPSSGTQLHTLTAFDHTKFRPALSR